MGRWRLFGEFGAIGPAFGQRTNDVMNDDILLDLSCLLFDDINLNQLFKCTKF